MPVKRPVKTPAQKPVLDDLEPRHAIPYPVDAMAAMEQDEEMNDDDIIFPDLTNRNIIVRLSRIEEGTRKYSYHGKLALMEARYSKVAELFGGGQYKAQAFEPDAKGSPRIRGTRTWILPGVYRPPLHLPGDTTTAPASSSTPSAEARNLSGMSASETLNTALVSQVIELMKATRTPAEPNPMLALLLPKAIEVLGDMVMKKSGGGGDDTLKELLVNQQAELRELRTALNAKPETPAKSLKDTIEDVMAIKDLISGGGDEKMDSESMMWAAGVKALEALSGAKSAPTPPVGTPQQAALADPNTPIWVKMLRAQKQKLLMAAGFALDPYYSAETAIKTMPPAIHGAVIEFLRKPDHTELAMGEIPELRNYQEWTVDFFSAACDIMLGEDEEDTPDTLGAPSAPETPGGEDASDPQG